MGMSNNFCKKLAANFPHLIEINMAMTFVNDSGLHELAKLKLNKFITKQDTLISVTPTGLTKFFELSKNLSFVDISGSSAINTEAIKKLADNNENLTHLYFDTYLLPGLVIKYVIKKCKIEVLKFSPSLTVTKQDNIKKYC